MSKFVVGIVAVVCAASMSAFGQDKESSKTVPETFAKSTTGKASTPSGASNLALRPTPNATNTLTVKCGMMTNATLITFPTSFAFHDGVGRLTLVFRTKESATVSRSLIIQLCNYQPNGFPRYQRAGSGAYKPLVMEQRDGLFPVPTLVVTDDNGKDVPIGTFWNITTNGKRTIELFGFDEVAEDGVVKITDVQESPQGHVVGEMQLEKVRPTGSSAPAALTCQCKRNQKTRLGSANRE